MVFVERASFMLQLTVDVLKANYEKEVEKLKAMMPDNEPSSSQDAAVVDTGLLLCLLMSALLLLLFLIHAE